jgi:hypothetical protein
MKTTVLIFILAFLLINGCSKDSLNTNNSNINASSEWLIPRDQVLDGGPGKDGIPALQNPIFISANEATYLSNDDLVLGFVNGEDARAYPHSILDWHEIVNDDINNESMALIYCPLTGTGIGWNRIVNSKKTTFGVSGLLYNSNIIPYDRETDSNWSQLLLQSVNGTLSGATAHTYNLVETTWGTWKQLFPATKVVSTQTGHNRNYGTYPYGNYKSTNSLIFPVANEDDRLHKKERVLAVFIEENVKAYRFDSFENALSLVNDEFESKNLVVAGSKDLNLMVAFNREIDNTLLQFEPVLNELPVVLLDNEGTQWDVFGRAVSGPREGQQLESIPQMMGYWFSFAAFYPDIAIF